MDSPRWQPMTGQVQVQTKGKGTFQPAMLELTMDKLSLTRHGQESSIASPTGRCWRWWMVWWDCRGQR